MARVYLETSIISYLAAHPSRDLIVAANQQVTRDWWERRRREFELSISELVIVEASKGDPDAAQRRLRLVAELPVLEPVDSATRLASALLGRKAVPSTSAPDALHIALAAAHGIDYLMTWNMAHILNAELRPRIESVCREEGFDPPVLCTPAELMGGPNVA